ncbi:hypothetical protein PENSPDRAFT_159732 [Peniophora sp. CONT]|nr:hypothetical protein PENSPDRAFT_159732 [Peniophora sp. CONT]
MSSADTRDSCCVGPLRMGGVANCWNTFGVGPVMLQENLPQVLTTETSTELCDGSRPGHARTMQGRIVHNGPRRVPIAVHPPARRSSTSIKRRLCVSHCINRLIQHTGARGLTTLFFARQRLAVVGPTAETLPCVPDWFEGIFVLLDLPLKLFNHRFQHFSLAIDISFYKATNRVYCPHISKVKFRLARTQSGREVPGVMRPHVVVLWREFDFEDVNTGEMWDYHPSSEYFFGSKDGYLPELYL